MIKKILGIKPQTEMSYSNFLKADALETYSPKLKKWRIGVAGSMIGVALITPFTAWSIPMAVRWMLK